MPTVSGEFVCQLEQVLEAHAQPYDEDVPTVNFDELLKELHGSPYQELPTKPGYTRCEDYEYEKNGTTNLFIVTCPHLGWRHISVTDRRTALDFAEQMKELVDYFFPEAKKIRVILDNLNTHTKGSLYEAFPPADAKRLADKLEFIYTPKHASWLNSAELEWRVLRRQCWNRRFATALELQQAVAAWERARNARAVKINWQFRIEDARVKLSDLYPKLPN